MRSLELRIHGKKKGMSPFFVSFHPFFSRKGGRDSYLATPTQKADSCLACLLFGFHARAREAKLIFDHGGFPARWPDESAIS